MIKLIALIKRRPDVAPEEFRRHYRDHHAALFQATLPADVAAAIRHYSQDHAVELGAADPAYDCVTEFHFDDLAGLRLWSDWYRGEGGRALRDDETRFMDTAQRVVVVTEVHDIGTGR